MAKRKMIQRPGGQAFAIRVKPKPPPDVIQARDVRAAEKLRKAEERKKQAKERNQKAEERKQKAEEQKKQREIRAKLREERKQQREQQREKKSSLKDRANAPRKRTRSLVWRRQQAWKKTESGESGQTGQAGQSIRVIKPLYRVPSLAEIKAALADGGNGYRVVSTFSGAGGACLGLKMAGYQVLWANDFIPAAQETYQINHPAAILDYRDVRDIHPEDILQGIGLEPGELEVMEGSPPCSGFSMAGQREDGWGTIKNYSDGRQQVDDLFFEYARLVDGICPMVFNGHWK